MMGSAYVTESRPKKTRQGRGKHSKYAATSRNSTVKDTEGRVVNVLSHTTFKKQTIRNTITIVFLVVLLFERCLEIYKDYIRYKKFEDTVPIFREEFEIPHSDIIGYYDGNELVAFTIAYKFKSVNCVWADQFAWNYKNKKLGLGHVANKNEIAL